MMRKAWLPISAIVLLPLLLILGGCGRGPAPLTQVDGKVAYKGVSLQGGTIVFIPDTTRGESGQLALGKISQDGTYHLTTGDSLGASVGWYRVTVTSLAPSSIPSPGQMFSQPYSILPDKYRDPQLSQLACEVKAGRINRIDFNLD